MVPSARALAPKLLLAGVLPVVGYSILRPHVSSDAIALAIVMVFPLADIANERVRQGRFEPIGLIALTGISVGIVGVIVFHGDATLLKIRDSLITGVFGVVCLASLAAPRPVMFYLGRAFATGGDTEKVDEFNKLLELPGTLRRFRFVTAVWGVGLVGEAIVRTLLAFTLSTERFLIVAQLISWSVLAALFVFTIRFARRSRERVQGPIQALAAAVHERTDDEILAYVEDAGGAEAVLDARFKWMTAVLNRTRAKDCVVGYEITNGPEMYRYVFVVKDGKSSYEKRDPSGARFVQRIGLPDYLRLASGELDGTKAAIDGKMTLDGDLAFAGEFSGMFGV